MMIEMLLDASPQTKTVHFPRFGLCTFAENEVLSFPWGLPGFSAFRRFLVLSVPGQEGYIWLQSLDDVNVALPMCDPWSLFDDYDAVLPLYAKQSLALEAPDDFCIMCICVVGKGAAEMTINLLAPVVINLRTRTARQVMLESQRYSVRTPIPRTPGAGSSEKPQLQEVVAT
ncbi:MAG: flagellar assembly protein FliW [Candidatus Velthaea sp.]